MPQIDVGDFVRLANPPNDELFDYYSPHQWTFDYAAEGEVREQWEEELFDDNGEDVIGHMTFFRVRNNGMIRPRSDSPPNIFGEIAPQDLYLPIHLCHFVRAQGPKSTENKTSGFKRFLRTVGG